MQYREDLVYEKHTGNIIGYTDLGEVNNHLLTFQRMVESDVSKPPQPAKSMLTFMVKGLFTGLKYPYAQFSCTKLTGDCLFQLFWEAVKRLERVGLRVTLLHYTLVTICDILLTLQTGPWSHLGWSLKQQADDKVTRHISCTHLQSEECVC